MVGRTLTGLVIGFLLAGCAGSPPTGPTTAHVTATPATSAPATAAPAPTRLAGSGCPVGDAAFCQRAVVAANALLAADSTGLLEVAAVETYRCDEMPAGIVPACRPGAVLSGHGVYSVASKIDVVAPDEYPRWLEDLFARVDSGYADDRGPGRFVVLGVGTCGPDDPQRRSYHLAFTVALRGEAGQPVQRWLGSLEFVRREAGWVAPLTYLDTVDAWRQEHSDPFRDLACGNVRPWRTT